MEELFVGLVIARRQSHYAKSFSKSRKGSERLRPAPLYIPMRLAPERLARIFHISRVVSKRIHSWHLLRVRLRSLKTKRSCVNKPSWLMRNFSTHCLAFAYGMRCGCVYLFFFFFANVFACSVCKRECVGKGHSTSSWRRATEWSRDSSSFLPERIDFILWF